jgi:DNA-binding response OmpR family regulator
MTQEKEPKKVLLVEDDHNLGTLLMDYLNAKGFVTSLAINGKQGFEKFISGNFDICILDVMMPLKDGFTLAEEIRQTDKNIPIIFVTAKSMKEDRLMGFNKGADDFLSKPFSMEELLLRIKAILRRTNPETPPLLVYEPVKIGSYIFDHHHQTLEHNGEKQRLTTKESDLLNLLTINKNDVMDRNYALNKIWGSDNYFNARSMDVYIAKLRKYLIADTNVEIVNVHGKGFKLLEN